MYSVYHEPEDEYQAQDVSGGMSDPDVVDLAYWGDQAANIPTVLPSFPDRPSEEPNYGMNRPLPPWGPPSGGSAIRPDRPLPPWRPPSGGPGPVIPDRPNFPNWVPPVLIPPQPSRPSRPIVPGRGGSNVRFLYGAINQPPVNIRIGNRTVINRFQYGNVTPYYRSNSGNVTIVLTNTLTGAIVFRGQFSLRNNTAYTMALVNNGNGISIFSIVDTRCPNVLNTGCIRAVNLSNTSGPVDIFLNGFGRMFRSVGFQKDTPVQRIPRGNYRAFVSEALPCGNNSQISFNENYSECGGTRIVIMDSSVVNIKSGILTTLYIIGRAYGYPALQIMAVDSDLSF